MNLILKKIHINNKGFSLLEIIMSAAALGCFAILVQSMLILGHSFRISQQNLFESMQTTQSIKQTLCTQNSSFKDINLATSRTYQDASVETTKDETDSEGNPITYHERIYQRIQSPTTPANQQAILAINITDANKGGFNFNGEDINRTIRGVTSPGRGRGRSTTPSETNPIEESDSNIYYHLYQDSHTIASFRFDDSQGTLKINDTKKFVNAYIFASRCVPNKSTSLYNRRHTFNPDNTKSLKASAVYILHHLSYKPFYLPSTDKDSKFHEFIKCCKDDPKVSNKNCQWDANYVPRMYIIHLTAATTIPSDPKAYFYGEIQTIQELPEAQDMTLTWGMGFMLSMHRQLMSQTSFSLYIMNLKNTCSTNTNLIQNCPDLSLGSDLEQKIIGYPDAIKTLIVPELSTCSGFSGSIDTTGLISL